MNLFKIGVQLSLVDKVTGALGTVSHATIAANAHVNSFQANLMKLQQKMDKLSSAKFMGEAVLHASADALGAMVDPAKEYHDQIVRMNMAGIEHGTIVKNIASAWETAGKIMTTTPQENIKSLMELRSVLTEHGGSMTEARELLPRFQEMKMVLLGASEMAPDDAKVDAMTFDAVKASEMIGKVSKEGIMHMADILERVMVASSGKLTPQNFQTFFKYAGAAKLVMDEDTIKYDVPELMIEMLTKGGGTGGIGGPGTRFASMFSTITSGIMSDATKNNLAEIGMMGDDGRALNADKAGMNMRKWVEEDFVPHILKAKPELAGEDQESQIKLMLEMARIIKGPRLTSATMQELHNKTQIGTISKWKELYDAVKPHDQLVKDSEKSTRVVDMKVQKSWETLMTVLGNEVLPLFIPVLDTLSEAFSKSAAYLKDNQWLSQLIVMGVTIAGVVGGIVAVAASFGLTAIAVGAAGLTMEVLAVVVLGVTAVVIGLYLAFKLATPIIQALANNWNTFIGNFVVGVATMIRVVTESIGGLISFFDKDKGRALIEGGATIANTVAQAGPLLTAENLTAQAIEMTGLGPRDIKAEKQTAMGQSNLSIAAGAINIQQLPGEDMKGLAERILKEIEEKLWNNTRTSGIGIGLEWGGNIG